MSSAGFPYGLERGEGKFSDRGGKTLAVRRPSLSTLALAAASFIWHFLFFSFHTPLGGIGHGLKGVKKRLYICVNRHPQREGLSHLK